MPGYRVFISYSHGNRKIATAIAETLRNIGLTPMWDKNFVFGHGFHDQIKLYIAHSHVFLPVITKASDERKWVHQEIGYAMALNIPVLPVAVGSLPSEMIGQLHAIELEESSDEPIDDQIKARFTRGIFDNLVSRYNAPSLALFECAYLMEERTQAMARYANAVTQLGYSGFVRQRGGLSSFHIPADEPPAPAWQERFRPQTRTLFHNRLL